MHADAADAARTDWTQIVTLYEQLHTLRPDPVVALNRAVAVAEVEGPEAGLSEVAALDAGRLRDHQPYHAARADLLARAGRIVEATAACERAIELTTNPTESAFLDERLRSLRADRG